MSVDKEANVCISNCSIQGKSIPHNNEDVFIEVKGCKFYSDISETNTKADDDKEEIDHIDFKQILDFPTNSIRDVDVIIGQQMHQTENLLRIEQAV